MAFDTLQVKAVEGLLSFKKRKRPVCHSVNHNHRDRSVYNDNIATWAPCQVRLICYCLQAKDRVIRIKFTRSCFSLPLLLLNPKPLHAFHVSS